MPTSEQETFRLRDIAVAAFAPTISNAIGLAAVTPVLAMLARQLGASVGEAAFLVALLGIGSLLTALPAGGLVARIGERRALALAGVVEAAAMATAALATSLAVLGAAVLVSGMAWAVFLLARQGFVIHVAPPQLLARAMSTLGGSHRIGGFVGPILGAGLLELSGSLRSVFWLAAVASLCATALVLATPELPGAGAAGRGAAGRVANAGPPDSGRGANAGTREGGPGEGSAARARPDGVLTVLSRHRRTLLSVGSAIIFITGSRALRTTLLPLWADHVGISASATSLVFGAAALLEIALFYPAGCLMDTRGRTVVAVPVVVLIGLGILALPAAHGLLLYTVLALLMAVGNGMGSGIVMTLGADTAPAEGRAQYLGGFRLAGDLGGAGSPLLVTALTAVVPLATACVVLGSLCLLGSLWVGHRVSRIDAARLTRTHFSSG